MHLLRLFNNFNSIKVRLELDHAALELSHDEYFNSIKVRLEREMGIGISNDLLFQFHKGAIRTLRLATKLTECYNFNSIKVRLERKKAYKYFFTSE